MRLATGSPKPTGNDVIIEKFMVIMTRYPDGKVYPTIIPLTREIRDANKKRKVKPKKEEKPKEEVKFDIGGKEEVLF